MKRKRYSVEQIVAAVKQHELGTSAADIARKLGIAEQTFYRWKKQYGGVEPGQARELKQLREENAKLKQVVANLSRDKAMLSDIAKKVVKAPQRRAAVTYLRRHYGGQRTAGVSCCRSAKVGAVVQVPSTAAGRVEAPHQGDCRAANPVRLQAHPHPAAAREPGDRGWLAAAV